ncbi:MAG TPA: class I SAM-dependent methyltransferase [Candidatus Eisenbacteria bacterium]|nr:class I SAM-dependent methyltransferase [Candidatus Eisenbacteria bacterium]
MTGSISWNPRAYARDARFVSELAKPLIGWLEPRPDETILDLGCGDGALTETIAASGAKVYAIDASRPQANAARARDLRVAVMDGHHLGFKSLFDGVFSNAALHWMKRPERVVSEVASILKPGGRFVGEFGGKGNVERVRAALHAELRKRGFDPARIDPWYFPSAEDFAALLARFGFHVAAIDLIPRPTRLPDDLNAWLEIFAQPFFDVLQPPERKAYLAAVRDGLKESLQDSEGRWVVDYVRLRFKATRN